MDIIIDTVMVQGIHMRDLTMHLKENTTRKITITTGSTITMEIIIAVVIVIAIQIEIIIQKIITVQGRKVTKGTI